MLSKSWPHLVSLFMVMGLACGPSRCPRRVVHGILDLKTCGLKEIDSSDFDRLKNVELIKLQNNNLTNINPYTFSKLTILHTLLLWNNPNLVMPPEGPFLISSSLRHLSLRDNNLGVVDPSAFTDMTSLEEVDFTGNPGCKQSRELAIVKNANYSVRCDDVWYTPETPISTAMSPSPSAETPATSISPSSSPGDSFNGRNSSEGHSFPFTWNGNLTVVALIVTIVVLFIIFKCCDRSINEKANEKKGNEYEMQNYLLIQS